MNSLILPISAYTNLIPLVQTCHIPLFKVNITFSQFVIDYLSMVLLFDAFTDHNANGSPTPWRGKYLSTEKEVKFGNKSESNLFQEIQKKLFIFA